MASSLPNNFYNTLSFIKNYFCFCESRLSSSRILADSANAMVIGIIHLVRTQNVPKNLHFSPLDTHTYVCVSGGKKCKFFGKFCVRTK